jgi:hypothetical protein
MGKFSNAQVLGKEKVDVLRGKCGGERAVARWKFKF